MSPSNKRWKGLFPFNNRSEGFSLKGDSPLRAAGQRPAPRSETRDLAPPASAGRARGARTPRPWLTRTCAAGSASRRHPGASAEQGSLPRRVFWDCGRVTTSGHAEGVPGSVCAPIIPARATPYAKLASVGRRRRLRASLLVVLSCGRFIPKASAPLFSSLLTRCDGDEPFFP